MGNVGSNHVVVLIHGIRDFASWQGEIRATLEDAGFKVEPTSYMRLDLLRFLVPFSFFREKVIDKIWNQIEDIRKIHNGAQISFIAHSFGTYVLAQILRRKFTLNAHKVIFCGSVVRYDFPFEQIADRFDSPILNDIGTADVWPAFAESVTVGYGSAGTYGFRRPRVRDRWHNGKTHSAFLNPIFCKKYWIPFLKSGAIIEGDLPAEPPPHWIRLLYIVKIKYLIVLMFFILTVPLGSYIWNFNYTPLPLPPDAVRLSDGSAGQRPFELKLAALPGPTFVEFLLSGVFEVENRTIQGTLASGSITTDPNPPKNFAEKITHIGFSACYLKRVGITDQMESYPVPDFFKYSGATTTDIDLIRGQKVDLPRIKFTINLSDEIDLKRAWLCAWLYSEQNGAFPAR